MLRSAPIEPGERAPDFAAVRGQGDGDRVRFYGDAGGRTMALVLAGARPADILAAVVSELREDLPPQVAMDIVTPDRTSAEATGGFHDVEGRVHGAYGVAPDGAGAVVVLDANLRVVVVHPLDDLEAILDAVADTVQERRQHEDDDSIVRRHAPVLLVRDALSSWLCQRVMDAWQSGDTTESGVETSTGDGRREVGDVQRKRRRDLTITAPDLLTTLTDHVGRRIMPELARAFAYRATRFEGFKAGCYDESSKGFFAPHRDNLSPATAHRRFALSLNLNDDYEGGELRFPEYGRQRYRPAPGEALVFSGSLLHEVLPVTRGRRFVLLSFVFNEADRRP